MILVGGSVVFFIALLLLPYLSRLLTQNGRRTRIKGFDHSMARSTLPGLHFRRPEPSDVEQIVALAREPATMAANRWGPEEADNTKSSYARIASSRSLWYLLSPS